MRLSDELMARIEGHAGRVTCRRCEAKIALDGRGDELLVTSGGRRVEFTPTTEVELDDETNHPGPSTDAGKEKSELRLSLAPPISDELKKRRAASLAAQLADADDDEPPPMKEAPIPHLRGEEDSLTPHTFDERGNKEDRIILPPDFKSSPMSSNVRDESFRSLYPQAAVSVHSSGEESALARENRRRGPKPPHEGLRRPVAPDSVRPTAEEGEGKKSNWAPWALACAAVIGLSVNVAMGPRDRGLSGAIYGLLGKTSASPASSVAALPEPAPVELAADPTGSEKESHDAHQEDGIEQPEDGIADEGDHESGAPEDGATKDPVKARANVPAVSPPPQERPTSTRADTRDSEAPRAKTPSESPSPEAENIPFSPSAAATAMRNAAFVAARCRKPGDPSGEARISITFSSSGKVTRATVSGPPFSGTATGSCIAEQFRRAEVPAFSGKRVTVNKTVTIQ